MRRLTAGIAMVTVLAVLGSAPGWAKSKPRSAQAEQQGGGKCCKSCTKGKACGDSCISKSAKCSKPPGCACDAH